MSVFHDLLHRLPVRDEEAVRALNERAQRVIRPAGALRRLDEVAEHIAGWQRTSEPSVNRPHVLVFAGDHGVAAAGVSAYPSEITAAMLRAVHEGVATINAFARSVGAELDAFDVGVGEPTGDIRTESALSHERLDAIAQTAIDAVDAAVDAGADLLVFGELGIGNTTISAAIPAAIIGGSVSNWAGRGTGVDDEGLSRKIEAITAALRRITDVTEPLEVLREIGGAEHAAIAAGCAQAHQRSVPVVLDGYVATSAVLPLFAANSAALDHCLVGHLSAEPGHRLLLDHIGAEPLLDLDMRLGEGTGALAAVPLVRLACAGVVDVATFDELASDGPPPR